jgi:hypothetical protein
MTSRPVAPVIPSVGRGRQRQHKPGAGRPIRSRPIVEYVIAAAPVGSVGCRRGGGREAEDLVGEVWNACPAEKGGKVSRGKRRLRLWAACSRMICR